MLRLRYFSGAPSFESVRWIYSIIFGLLWTMFNCGGNFHMQTGDPSYRPCPRHSFDHPRIPTPPPGNFSSCSIQPLVPSMLNSTFSSIHVPTNPFHITFEKKIIELWCRESKQDCLCKRLFSHKPLQPSLFFSSQWVWGHKSYRASTIQLSRNNGGLVKVSAGWRW